MENSNNTKNNIPNDFEKRNPIFGICLYASNFASIPNISLLTFSLESGKCLEQDGTIWKMLESVFYEIGESSPSERYQLTIVDPVSCNECTHIASYFIYITWIVVGSGLK